MAALARPLALAPRALTPLAVAAAALALVVPSGAVAARSDVLLAVLVLATALGMSVADLAVLRRHAVPVALLSIAPLVVLGAIAWLVGRPFAAPARDGLLAVGLSSSEVASVGLVALAGGDAAVALGAVTGSLVVSALAGPLLIEALGGGGGHAAAGGGTGHLLVRFALVVIVPLAVGVAARTAAPRLAALDAEREGVGALAVAALVYAALSGTGGAHGLGGAALAAAIFLALSALLAEGWRRLAPAPVAVAGALAVAMRDFAVAAALAAEAFGARAGAVPGIYGVMMLLAGSIAAGWFARAAQREGSPP